MTANQLQGRPDFGLDAPGVVRNLLLVGAAGLVLGACIMSGLLPSVVTIPGTDIRVAILGMTLGPGIACAFTGAAMIWTSRIGKVRRRDRNLRAIPWRGDEQVVDVGCGRGLMLVGAAQQLTTGRATGIDIWRAEDLANNSASATFHNVRIAGVTDRVAIETADMRALPQADASIDVAVSCAAIHNLDKADDRATAIREIARVLKPGGFALIDDIRHFAQYRDVFAQSGCTVLQRLDSRIESTLWTLLSFGSLRPHVMLVQKRRETRNAA